MCPQLIFVEPDGAKYDFLHRQLINLLLEVTPNVEVFSIDEAFLDLSECTNNFAEAVIIAQKIKEKVFSNLGEWVTCSIGIAQNKLLAKLASDKNKPNGLLLSIKIMKKKFYFRSKLTDFCGLAKNSNTSKRCLWN